MKTIGVSDWVKKKLEGIKEREEHTSLDSVIRVLILERKIDENDTGTRDI